MFSTSTLPESQGSCTERATAPTVPPPPALHVSKALPLPSLSPAASPKPRSFGVGWDSTACEAAKQQEQMRPPQRVAQKKQDEPPHPSHHPPPAVPGEAEMLQSAGDQRGHGRAANPPTSPGPPQLTPILRVSLGGERTPPPLPVMANKAFGERCEILPPFPLLHRQLLRLRPRHLARRGGSRGACGRVCRQALSWDPSITRDLRGLLLVWSEPWSAEGFSDSVPPPISPPCEIRHRDKKKGIVAGSRNPHLKDDPV